MQGFEIHLLRRQGPVYPAACIDDTMVTVEDLVTKNLSKYAIQPDILDNSGFSTRRLDYLEISMFNMEISW